MPIHWDAEGHPDGALPRALGLLLLPAVGLLTASLAGALAAREEGSREVALPLAIGTGGFLLGVHVLVIRAALSPGHHLALGWLFALMGLLIAGLGALMPRTSPNPYVGIRLPWTMNDEICWRLTHRFAARSMIGGGVAALLASALLSGAALTGVAVGAILLGCLAPIPYSYVIHRMRG
jgi:uncharacterized membrane protein